MTNRISFRYRKFLFALVMSGITSSIVLVVVLGLHGPVGAALFKAWLHTFPVVWPVVFVAILIIAPRVDRLLDCFVERAETR